MSKRWVPVAVVALVLASVASLSACRRGSNSSPAPTGVHASLPTPARPARLGEELVTNGTFATVQPGDATLPAGWTRYQSTSRTVLLVKEAGASVLQTRNDARRKLWQEVMQHIPGLRASGRYQVTFEARVQNTVPGFVAVIEQRFGAPETNLARLSFSDRNWTAHQFVFEATSGTLGAVSLLLGPEQPGNPDGVAEFRRVSLREVLP